MKRRRQQPELSIIECLRDRRLLGRFIDDESTYAAWLCFLRAFFALRPEPGDMRLYSQCTSRAEWPRSPSTEAWLPIGVRGGKSFMIAVLAVYLAFFRRYRLSRGELGYVLIVAPTRKQAGIIKSYISGFLRDHPILRGHVQSETAEEIRLDNQLAISTLSSDYKSIRGFTAVACIVDEIAYLTVEGSRPDTEVVRALRSRLLTTGGPLLCIGSPYAKRGELYSVFRRHYGADGSPVLVWRAPSLVMNPTLPAKVIAQARQEDPEAAKADYDAEFRSDIETFVSREVVDACVAPGRYELPPISGIRYRAFVDPAGGSGQDSMTLAIAHNEGALNVLDAVREIRPPFSPEAVASDFAKLLKRYRARSVVGDRFGGEWPRERLRAHGISYILADRSKSDIYRDFLPLLNSGEVQLLDNETVVNQLCALERRTARGGRDSIDHPPGGRDDLCNAVAGVVVMPGATRRVGTWGSTTSDGQNLYRHLDLRRAFPGANSLNDLVVHKHGEIE
jgi:hypothetical protein